MTDISIEGVKRYLNRRKQKMVIVFITYIKLLDLSCSQTSVRT